MTDESHDAASYRLLFGLIGLGLLALVGIFIVASALVAPGPVVVVLIVLWIAGAGVAAWAWRTLAWAPLVIGTALAIIWIAAITISGGPA